MKKNILLVCLLGLIGACTTPAPHLIKASSEAAPNVEDKCTNFVSTINKSKPVYLSFKDSPKLTQQLNDILKQAGFITAADETVAQSFIVDGEYVAVRPRNGRYAKEALAVLVEKPNEAITTYRERNGYNINLSGGPLGMVMSALISKIYDSTGATEKLAQVGARGKHDPDGNCIEATGTCEAFKFGQGVSTIIVDKNNKEVCSITVTYINRRLMPETGIDLTKEILQKKLFSK